MFEMKNIRTAVDNDPKYYVIADEGLRKAVDMSIWLQKPLLLTGAPGTGKTQLASRVAYELSQLDEENLKGCSPFGKKPLLFNTKTTCNASDLFYSYDAIGHFQKRYADEKNAAKMMNSAHPYITLNALGMAILQSYGKKALRQHEDLSSLQWVSNFEDLLDEPRSSVVLIDEIDKAPRDFPNDLLAEIENYHFNIAELNMHVRKADEKTSSARIIVFMTSNFEKNLPDAFLRRCLFYHIPAPGTAQLLTIVCSRMEPYLSQLHPQTNGKAINEELRSKFEMTIHKFESYKTLMTDKQPSTSELLEWIKVLEAEGLFKGNLDFNNLSTQQLTLLKYTLPIIAKSKDDLERSAAGV